MGKISCFQLVFDGGHPHHESRKQVEDSRPSPPRPPMASPLADRRLVVNFQYWPVSESKAIALANWSISRKSGLVREGNGQPVISAVTVASTSPDVEPEAVVDRDDTVVLADNIDALDAEADT